MDLYLLHWPEGDWLNLYSQIIEEYKKGRCRAFGVCNLSYEQLKEIQQKGLELPMIVQTEMHPLCARKELRLWCQEHGIQVMAHTPTGKNANDFYNSEIMHSLTSKYGKTAHQIIMRWHFQNKVIPVVSCFDKNHMKENLNIFDFVLTSEDMGKMDGLDQNLILLDSKGIDDPNFIYND